MALVDRWPLRAQFAVGGVVALTMWTLNLHEKPKIDKDLVLPSSRRPRSCASHHSHAVVAILAEPLSRDWHGGSISLRGKHDHLCGKAIAISISASLRSIVGTGTEVGDLLDFMRLQVISVLPLAVVHTLGNLLTNVSLGQVAVSFTHTIKVTCLPSLCPHLYHASFL